ncbi:MAG: DUF1643 domain-containing protein [Eubacteriales bacterium]|jgi:hypothetical protein
MIKGAIIDNTGDYRYSLWRIWDETKPKITFIMLNGSTADAEQDDPTLRRCIGYAKAWGFGSLEVVNLFGYRTTFPTELKKAADPVGAENDSYILKAIKGASMVVVAWGSNGSFKKQDKYVLGLLKNNCVEPYCIDVSKDGHPKHPLYLKADLKLRKLVI